VKTDQKNISIINKDCTLEGNFTFKGYLIVAGSVNGMLNGDTVITEEGSRVTANVKSNFLTIAGSFQGEISTMQTLTLLKTSEINASIRCSKLIVEEGCTINGKISAGTHHS
jgi:cytoskeletal protein CcmA (bactofilin family)